MYALWFIFTRLCIVLVTLLCERFGIEGGNATEAGTALAVIAGVIAAELLHYYCPGLMADLKAKLSGKDGSQ